MTKPSRVQRAALLVGAALLGVYFAFAAFSQTPLSPAKVKFAPYVNTVLGPYLAQNWMLFAPDPIMADQGIIARGRCTDGTVTAFYDVTKPSLDKVRTNRFFPSRMSRIVSNGIQQYSTTDDLMRRLREQDEKAVAGAEDQADKTKNKNDGALALLPYEKRSRDEAVNFLSRYAWTQMPTACGKAGAPAEVQVRMYIRTLPPWSQRNNPDARGELDGYDFPWKKAADLQ